MNTKNLPEELAQTLDKVVTQMDIITRTVGLLDQRIQKFDGYVKDLTRALESLHSPTHSHPSLDNRLITIILTAFRCSASDILKFHLWFALIECLFVIRLYVIRNANFIDTFVQKYPQCNSNFDFKNTHTQKPKLRSQNK